MSKYLAVLTGDKKPLEELESVNLAFMEKITKWNGNELTVILEIDEILDGHVDLEYMENFFTDVRDSYAKSNHFFAFYIEEVIEDA